MPSAIGSNSSVDFLPVEDKSLRFSTLEELFILGTDSLENLDYFVALDFVDLTDLTLKF